MIRLCYTINPPILRVPRLIAEGYVVEADFSGSCWSRHKDCPPGSPLLAEAQLIRMLNIKQEV